MATVGPLGSVTAAAAVFLIHAQWKEKEKRNIREGFIPPQTPSFFLVLLQTWPPFIMSTNINLKIIVIGTIYDVAGPIKSHLFVQHI